MSLVLDLIFPRRCYGCHRLGAYLCPHCRQSLVSQSIKHFDSGPLESSLPLFKYHGIIRKMIIDLKYHFVSDLAPDLTSLASDHLSSSYQHLLSYWQQHHYTLVPIPLSRQRSNWRGFNQSEIIAFLLARQLKLPYQKLLLRPINTTPQVRLKDKMSRYKNLKHAFSLISSPPPNILLLDDVVTTYSTFRHAASTLRRSGAKSVWALSLAGHC